MTPLEFIEEIRLLHKPYHPRMVSAYQMIFTPEGTQLLDVTKNEYVENYWWCDGCNCYAQNCRILPLFVLLEGA